MTAFPKYPAYKDSGVEWLGEVPQHWEVEKARWMFRKLERPVHKDDGIVTCFRDGQVALRSRRREEGFTMAILEQGYQSVRKGELVVHGMDAFAGAIGVSEDDGKCTPEYSVLEPTRPDINNHYFAHLLRVMAARGYIHIICPSVRERAPRFRFPKLQDSHLPYPPRAEQDRIVAFLDEKTAQIDALIAKKQRQIELLDEQKAILINRAVTRGLHPNPDLQDSGIPWIGPIPKHWELSMLKRQGRLKGGIGFPHEEQGKSDEELHFYKVGDLSASSDGIQMSASPNKISRKVARRLGAEIFPPSTIVYAKIGAALLLNRRRITRELCCIDNNMTAFIPRRGLNPMWAHLWTTQLDFSKLVNPGPVPSLSEGRQGALPFLVPPRKEQDEIVSHLNELAERFQKLIGQIESQIQTLQTLRSTLIAHAVTGKMRVE